MGWINHSGTKSKFSISLDQLFRILYGLLFNVCPSWRMPKYVEIRCWPLAFTSYKAFLKAEKRSEKSLLPHSLYDSYYCLIGITSWDFGYMCIVTNSVHDVIIFLTLLSSRFFTWPERPEQKFKYVKNEKSFSGEIKSIFHHF